MGQIQSFAELLSLLIRRRWLIIAITLIGTLVAVAYAKSRPDTYETAAVIQVELPTVVQSGDGTPAPASGAAQMLQSIEQRLTTRENLAAVIARHGLYKDLPGLSDDKKIDLLRASVSFQGIDSAAGQAYGQPRSLSAILVYARLGDPELAARVANDFAQGILDQSSSDQKSRADENVDFFKEEEARVWAQLSQLEAEIAAYKNAHADTLPTLHDALRDELVNLDADLRRSGQDRVALQGQAETIRAKGTLRETDRRELDDITARLTVLDAQLATTEARRAEVQTAIAATPEVERVLSGYERQLTQLQDQYQVITRRMAEAQTEQLLAERRQAERFTLLERAVTPEYAMGGGGKKIALAGAVGSLMAGLALAFLLDLLHPVVRTAAQMERQLDLRPVVSIPEVRPATRTEAHRRLGRGIVKLLDDPTKPLLGLPRYAVVATAATLVLVAAAAAIA